MKRYLTGRLTVADSIEFIHDTQEVCGASGKAIRLAADHRIAAPNEAQARLSHAPAAAPFTNASVLVQHLQSALFDRNQCTHP
jgi:hypothetical protein